MASGATAAARALETSLKWLAVIESQGLEEMHAYNNHLDVVVRASMVLGKTGNVQKYRRMRSAWCGVVLGNPEIPEPSF